MEPQKVLRADYLDIIFDHYNKNYGGYQLRKHYAERVYKAVGIALFSVMVLCAYSLWKEHSPILARIITDNTTTTILTDVKPPIVAPPPPIRPTSPPASTAPAKTPPHIVNDNTVLPDKPPVENATIIGPSLHTGTGTDPNAIASPGVGGSSVTGTASLPAIASAPLKYVSQMPEFAGLNGYLNKSLHYPDAARNMNIQGRVIISFVVNEDGSISSVTLVRGIGGGCDEEALRVVGAMPKWKPGKQNGQPVKVLFTLPVVFKLQ